MLFQSLLVFDDPVPRSAAFNMAADELLLRLAEPVLRIYRWRNRAVSFGYFIRHAMVAAAFPGRELVRRMTGGGIVEHGSDFTYTIAVPAGHPVASTPGAGSYREIHAAIARWLESRGVPTELAAAESGQGDVCFQKPVRWDITLHGEKIAGAAQRRTRAGLLHQGSIVCPGLDCSGLAAALGGACTLSDGISTAEAEALAAAKYAHRSWGERV